MEKIEILFVANLGQAALGIHWAHQGPTALVEYFHFHGTSEKTGAIWEEAADASAKG